MSAVKTSPSLEAPDTNVGHIHPTEDEIKHAPDVQSIASDQKSIVGEVLSQENVDPVLKAKLHLVNNASHTTHLRLLCY